MIAPEGKLVEQYSTDAASRALAKTFGDDGKAAKCSCATCCARSTRRKDDKRIERVLLRVDRMSFSGYASIREVAAALARLRASGKQVVAFGESFDQGQYLLAAQANEVYLDPMGGLMLEGLGRYRQYYREGLQDKLGVDVHLFRVGEYKSAAEPYILDAASPESKEADLFWMNDIWQRYLGDIARVRKLTPQQLGRRHRHAAAGPRRRAAATSRKYALQQKLVDGLKTEDEVDELLARARRGRRGCRGRLPRSRRSTTTSSTSTAACKRSTSARRSRSWSPKARLPAASSRRAASAANPPPSCCATRATTTTSRRVVLRVDSPGGEVFASEQIRREVAALKAAGKPVVVSMGDVAASGGYWICMNADRIYADPSTITGSIGIFGLIPTIPRTLDKIGVHTDGVGTTRFAGAFDITPPAGSRRSATMVQSVIDKGYRDFTGRVAQARGRSVGRDRRDRARPRLERRAGEGARTGRSVRRARRRDRRCRGAREARQARGDTTCTTSRSRRRRSSASSPASSQNRRAPR